MRSGVVDLDHPENALVLRRLARSGRGAAPDLAPDEVADQRGLGVHPDLMYDFWNILTEGIPDAKRCARVVYGKPVLASPVSGVIFGFAGGTHTVAFRLPPADRDAALAAGATRILHFRAHPEIDIPASTDDITELGEAWVFCDAAGDKKRWCAAARAFADVAA
ncbi:MAG TPA: hypothetical protein VFT45_17680 [Longimicrobium sp.]|nr:hypothetical protein [Longimicrobium sp.]